MIKDIFTTLNHFFIVTSVYGQTYYEPDEIQKFYSIKTINIYFYFTNFSLFFATITLILSSLKNKFLKKIFKLLLPVILVYEFIISAVYWTIFFVFQEFVKTNIRAENEEYCLIRDLSQHLFPFIGLSICFFNEHIEFQKEHIMLNFSLCLIYCLMSILNKYIKGVYQYGFVPIFGIYGVILIYFPIIFLILSLLIKFSIFVKNKYRKN